MATKHPHHLHKSTKKSDNLVTLDFVVNIFMFMSPLFEIPQAINIYTQKNSHTVSLATWSLFFVASVAWLIYGLRHKLRSVVIIQIIYMVIEASVVVGILLYP